MAESEQFERGLEIRREVLGTDYVDANVSGTDEFMMGFQRLLTEWAWGYAWSRPGLDRKTTSMLNLAILMALGRPQELGIYVKGALSTGVSVAEIQEVLLHATVYCGTPAGRQAFQAAHEALKAEGALEAAPQTVRSTARCAQAWPRRRPVTRGRAISSPRQSADRGRITTAQNSALARAVGRPGYHAE